MQPNAQFVIAVAIPVLVVLCISALSVASSRLLVWDLDKRSALASVVHGASKQSFAASQDKNKYMALIDSAAACAQLDTARRMMSDDDLATITGLDVRSITRDIEKQHRDIVARLSKRKRETD